MKLAEFDYALPPELIAQKPSEKRDQSRLLVVAKNGELEDDVFANIQTHLKRGDLLVVNNSKVFPARLIGKKQSGGKAEILLNHELNDRAWEALGRNVKHGDRLSFSESGLSAEIIERMDKICRVRFNITGPALFSEIERIGHVPLPPYIKREDDLPEDYNRYQTVYAKERGSAAAPTAGLHFSVELFETIKKAGIEIAEVTLHVGLGTFMAVETEDIEDHKIHSERYSVEASEYEKIIRAKKEGRRIIAVGTTTGRTLETLFLDSAPKLSGWTDIFIYPGFKFKCIDGLVTNFHLPKSSLLMLTSALIGKDRLFEAYAHAIQSKYRFYSYGDAMLII